MMKNFKLPKKNKYQASNSDESKQMHIKENLPKLMEVNFKDGHKHDKCGFIAFHKQDDGSYNVPKAKIGISFKCVNANSLEENILLAQWAHKVPFQRF